MIKKEIVNGKVAIPDGFRLLKKREVVRPGDYFTTPAGDYWEQSKVTKETEQNPFSINDVQFAIFNPRVAPFGSACVECEAKAPAGKLAIAPGNCPKCGAASCTLDGAPLACFNCTLPVPAGFISDKGWSQ